MSAADGLIAGRYELATQLGYTGMSEVWLAHDRELGRRVALKLLAPAADRARFEREARAVASLAHPNVMQVYDYGEELGRPYMVLEYVPGGTLEERLAAAGGKPLADDAARVVAAGMAAGLAHAHARGVVHRDLKPANVLFDDDGRPKLGDFGIARLAAGEGTLTEAGTVLGTAAYISPEQAAGAPATPASDVYSFGVILYRMLTGRLPFASDDPLELVLMHRDALPPPVTAFRPDPPGRLEATTMAALEKDPRERPADGTALLAALGTATAATAVLGDDATRVLPVAGTASATTVLPTTADAEPPPSGRKWLPLLIGGLVVLLIAGGAVAYALTRPDSSTDTTTTAPLTSISIPTATSAQQTTTAPTTTQPTTTAPTTTAPPTTTQPTTTAAPPPTTTVPPLPTTTVPPTTTETTLTLPLPTTTP